MKITKRQLRRIIKEALESSMSPNFPDVSHPSIAPYADKMGYNVPGREGSWFKEYQSYTYAPRPNAPQSTQAIVLYYLPDGNYTARITGSYDNTLADVDEGWADPIAAIDAALDRRGARDLLTKVGETIEPGGGSSTWPD